MRAKRKIDENWKWMKKEKEKSQNVGSNGEQKFCWTKFKNYEIKPAAKSIAQATTSVVLNPSTEQSTELIDRQSILLSIAQKIRLKDIQGKDYYDFDGGRVIFGPNRVEDTGINKTIVVNHKERNFLFEGFEIPFELKELF